MNQSRVANKVTTNTTPPGQRKREMNRLYLVVYLEHEPFNAGSVKQKHVRVFGLSQASAIHRAKNRVGKKWQSLVRVEEIEDI